MHATIGDFHFRGMDREEAIALLSEVSTYCVFSSWSQLRKSSSTFHGRKKRKRFFGANHADSLTARNEMGILHRQRATGNLEIAEPTS